MSCSDKCQPSNLEHASPDYVRVLWIVVGLNGAMFFIGVVLAYLGGSVSVRSDVLDFLGDAAATGVGLLLIGRPQRTRAKASMVQGIVLGALGVGALWIAALRIWSDVVPEPIGMGVYGVLGLAVNLESALLLLRHRHGDSNVRAVWLYSRNDAIGNIAVLLAAGAVAVTQARWPDVVVGAIIAGLFLHSAYEIALGALLELRKTRVSEV